MAVASVPGRHGAEWLAVCASVRLDAEQAGSHSQGGVHRMTRQTTGVTPPTSRWHCPYRNTLQQTRRWSHVAGSAWQWHPQALGAHGRRLQST